jgi:hypothetical protein
MPLDLPQALAHSLLRGILQEAPGDIHPHHEGSSEGLQGQRESTRPTAKIQDRGRGCHPTDPDQVGHPSRQVF